MFWWNLAVYVGAAVVWALILKDPAKRAWSRIRHRKAQSKATTDSFVGKTRPR
jgi:hypothetical protein